MYDVFEHTADLGIRVEAPTLGLLLADAARGLVAVLTGDLAQVRPAHEERLTVAGREPEWLLQDWLAEVLAAFDVRRMLLCEFEVDVDDRGLTALVRGEPYDPARHHLAHEIKAITLHELDVRRAGSVWQATFIVDI
jgi:SHS2 domain-containing protein